MIIREYGDSAARVILVQPVGQHELPLIDDEIVQIGQITDRPFRYLAVQVENWNRDLSPWPAPAVFGDEDFGDGAEALLEKILSLCAEQDKDYIIGGYSLAGLFALWSACRTDVFSGAAAASPSLWFPGFSAYMKEKGLECEMVYLSLLRFPGAGKPTQSAQEIQRLPQQSHRTPEHHSENPQIKKHHNFFQLQFYHDHQQPSILVFHLL